MKRLYLAIAALAVALVLGAASVPSASAAPQNSVGFAAGHTYNIVFDGYCDGMTLNVPGYGGAPYVDGQHTGSCNGVYGLIGIMLGNSVVVTDYTGIANGYMLMYKINANGTWSNWYDCSGSNAGQVCGFLTGTWSFGTPSAPSKDRTATSTAVRGR